MTAKLPLTGIQTQSLAITTDVTQTTPTVICDTVATLTPAANYISMSTDFQTITFDKVKVVLPTDIGTHTFTITVTSKFHPDLVAAKLLTFDV